VTFDLSIPTSGYSVLLKSIKYQYYPIFMLILLGRDVGPMLIAETKSLVLKGTRDERLEAPRPLTTREELSQSESDTPLRTWNILISVLRLNVLLWYSIGIVDDRESAENTTDFLSAFIFSTIGTAIIAEITFFLERTRNGKGLLTEYVLSIR
jgi:Na+/H+ antiporter NhaC